MTPKDTTNKDTERDKDRDKEIKTEDSKTDAPDPETRSTIHIIIEENMTANTEASRKKKTPLKNGRDKKMRMFYLIAENSDSTVPPEAIPAKNPKTHKK